MQKNTVFAISYLLELVDVKLRLLWKADIKDYRLVTSELKLNVKMQGPKKSDVFCARREVYQFYGARR